MRILIATVQVPFVRGGAEIHAESLEAALVAAGHQAEIVQVPFKWYPPERMLDQMLACRMFDLTESSGTRVDLLIGLKFPAYYMRHPNKVLWILHQHRQAYDLWSHPLAGDMIHYPAGLEVRDAIIEADRKLIPEAKRVYANSKNVAARLSQYCGIASVPLYHPPPSAGQLFCGESQDYFFFPSRLTPIKRQHLVVEALALTKNPVRMCFAGVPDYAAYLDELKASAARLKLKERIEFAGSITEEEKFKRYAHCVGVVYPPVDEDYGYVTLEGMLSSKPVITCSDSGGPNEFVDNATGFVVAPDAESLAAALDELWENRERAKSMGVRAFQRYQSMNITWPQVVRTLLQ